MKIVDLYWKWKRILRRNSETIARVITIVLVAILVGVVGYASYTIIRDDAVRAAEANRIEIRLPLRKPQNTIMASLASAR